MSENMTANKSAQKIVFGAPLLKSKITSEQQVKNKPEKLLENGRLLAKEILQKGSEYTNLDKLKESSVNTKIPESINIHKTNFPQEEFLENVIVSIIELSQEGGNANLDTFKEASSTTKIVEYVNIEKKILESDVNNIKQTSESNISPTSLKENITAKDSAQFSPKKPVTAYLSWSIIEREKVKNDLGNVTFGEVGKELGKRWAALNPEIKQSYQDKYREEKDKYEITKRSNNLFGETEFKNANNAGSKKRKLETLKPEGPKSKKMKKIKDKSAPKKPPSAFLVWSKVQREKITGDMGNLSFIDMGKELGKLWKTEAPEVKNFYQNIYKENKDKYDKDLENYNICQSTIKTVSDTENLDNIEKPVDQEFNFDTSKKIVTRKCEGGNIKKALRPRKDNYFKDCGVKNSCWGPDMVKPYFRFIMGNWREYTKKTKNIIPDAGPLDVIDFLNQRWGEQGDDIEKYKKPIPKKFKQMLNSSYGEGEHEATEDKEVQDNEPEILL